MSKVSIRGVAYIGDGDRRMLRVVEIEVDVDEGGDLDDDVAAVSMTTKARLAKLLDAQLHEEAETLLARLAVADFKA